MNSNFPKLSLALCLSLLKASSGWATTLAAKKDGALVLKEARKDAPTLLTLKAGQTLDADTRSGMYWRVKLPEGGVGFISVLQVQHQASGDDSLQSELRNKALAARKESSEEDNIRVRSAVMGVRGLAESQELASAGQLRPDTAAVYRMEDRTFAPERIVGLEALVQEELEKTVEARQPKP